MSVAGTMIPHRVERPEKLVPRRSVDRTILPFGGYPQLVKVECELYNGQRGYKRAADMRNGVYYCQPSCLHIRLDIRCYEGGS